MDIAIVDDLKEERIILHKLLEEATEPYQPVTLHDFTSGEAFLNAVSPGRFDLCFMDIYMEGIDGIETARRLREIDEHCKVIILTSSPNHGEESFLVKAVNYLKKPIDLPRLTRAMEACREWFSLQSLCLPIISDRREYHIPYKKIESVVTIQRNSQIRAGSQVFTVSRHQSFEELTSQLLKDYRFLLLGKGTVINLKYADRVEENCLIMKNGEKFPVSRRRLLEVTDALIRFQLND